MRVLALVLASLVLSVAAQTPQEGAKARVESLPGGEIIPVPFRWQQSETGPVLAPAYPETKGMNVVPKFKDLPLYGITTTGAQGAPVAARSDYETWLSLGVLVFGIIVLAGEVAVMLKREQGWDTQSIRIVGLTLIVVSGVFLITSGYSQNQIAPMIGLFGAAVGYLLGKTDPK